MMATCVQEHRVMIHDRGGERRILQLQDLSSVSWKRRRDAISEARVTVSGNACRVQATPLGMIEPKRHEMVIFRGAERVWEGPIMQVGWYGDRVEIVAHDVMRYLAETVLTKDWPGPDNGGPPLMGDRIDQIITHELTVPYTMRVGTGTAATNVTVQRWEQLTPPANVLPFLEITPGTVQMWAETEAFEMLLGDHIAALVRSGLDYTVIGRRIKFWDSELSLGRTRTLTEADFTGELQVFAAGTEHTDISHVVGQGEDPPYAGDPVPPLPVGNAGGNDPYYGAWTALHTTESEGETTPTQDALNTQARRRWLGRTPVPVDLVIPPSSGLLLSHDLTVHDLVPGVLMPVRATLNLRPVSQLKRLDEVSVTETAEGETVSITLVNSGEVQGA